MKQLDYEQGLKLHMLELVFVIAWREMPLMESLLGTSTSPIQSTW